MTNGATDGATEGATDRATGAGPRRLGTGLFWNELALGDRFVTQHRTLTETDLVSYVNLTWFTEELFTDARPREGEAITGRVVPGGLVYACAEGLVRPLLEGAGLAFLSMQMDVHAPIRVGDTIHVEIEVIERRAASRGNRGLVRTRNAVVNQNGETVLVYTPLRLLRGTP